MHRPLEFLSALEMCGELGRDILRVRAKGRLEPPGDSSMELDPPPRRHALVQDFLIERMGERIATGECSVRPLHRPARPEDVLSHQASHRSSDSPAPSSATSASENSSPATLAAPSRR